MSRLVVGLALALALTALSTSPLAACTCGGTSEDSALQHADVVFIGVVSDVSDGTIILDPTYTSSMTMYTFAVEESLKGDPADFVVIRSFPDEAGCGIPMAIGERWKIFAHREDLFGNVRVGELWVWLCDANDRLAVGVPVPLIPGDRLAMIGLGLVAVGLAFFGLVLTRTRRRAATIS